MNMSDRLGKMYLVDGAKLNVRDVHVVVVDDIVRNGDKSMILFHVGVLYSDKRGFLQNVLDGTLKELAQHEKVRTSMISKGSFSIAN